MYLLVSVILKRTQKFFLPYPCPGTEGKHLAKEIIFSPDSLSSPSHILRTLELT